MIRMSQVPLLLLATLCTGCVAPIAFISPCAPGPDPNNNSCQASAPVTQTTMSFDTNFDPSNSLAVTYDNQAITGNFSPPPAPGGNSSAPLPPPPGPNYYTTGSHVLQASSTCGFFCVYPTKTVTFTPPSLAVSSASATNFPNNPVSASLTVPARTFVVTNPIMNSTVQVTLTANPPVVLFMASPQGPGSSAITVPVTGGEASFYVRGVGGTPLNTAFTITGIAAGCQIGVQSGTITP